MKIAFKQAKPIASLFWSGIYFIALPQASSVIVLYVVNGDKGRASKLRSIEVNKRCILDKTFVFLATGAKGLMITKDISLKAQRNS